MRYMGSKTRLAKHIIPIIDSDRPDGQLWVEPFVGGGNMIDKATGPRIGSDSNKYLIAYLEQVAKDPSIFPKSNQEFTEDDYMRVKTCYQEFDEDLYPLVAFAGFGISFGGKWFQGWSRCRRGIDYVELAYKNAVKQSTGLQGCQFLCCSYECLRFENLVTIYCDPPYAGTTKYKDTFDSDKFWQWVRDRSIEGHRVFVSEYSAPEDFECVWSFETCANFASAREKAEPRIERLFVYAG